MIRAFIAIQLSDQVRTSLAHIQSELQSANPDVKWVEPENLHLTLKFLGSVPAEKITYIQTAVESATANFPAFTITLTELGGFPRLERPKVIWTGAKMTCDLSVLVKDLNVILEPFGISKEDRAFSAHITLGRVRSFKNLTALAGKLKEIAVPEIGQDVRTVSLMKSELSAQGPRYRLIKELSLGHRS